MSRRLQSCTSQGSRLNLRDSLQCCKFNLKAYSHPKQIFANCYNQILKSKLHYCGSVQSNITICPVAGQIFVCPLSDIIVIVMNEQNGKQIKYLHLYALRKLINETWNGLSAQRHRCPRLSGAHPFFRHHCYVCSSVGYVSNKEGKTSHILLTLTDGQKRDHAHTSVACFLLLIAHSAHMRHLD